MAFFTCTHCDGWKLFAPKEQWDGKTVCVECFDRLKAAHEAKKREEKEAERRRKKREADERLKKRLKKERKEQEESVEEVVKEVEETTHEAEKREEEAPSKPEKPSVYDEAKKVSKKLPKVLYIFADVKHVRAIEWKNGKERVALNKEREIRRTHKGGFSQEKFQRFIDAKKEKSSEWAIDNLSRDGVLRFPYDKILIESEYDEEIRGELEKP